MTEFERGFKAGLLEGMDVEQERILAVLARQLDREVEPVARIMLKSVMTLIKGKAE